MFDIIYPSLKLDGTHKEKDRDQTRKYINGVLRDGRGLLEWALTWTDLGSFETQSALVLQLHQAKLPSNPTCMMLYTFSNQLLKCWSRCAGNDPSSPSSLDIFWLRGRIGFSRPCSLCACSLEGDTPYWQCETCYSVPVCSSCWTDHALACGEMASLRAHIAPVQVETAEPMHACACRLSISNDKRKNAVHTLMNAHEV